MTFIDKKDLQVGDLVYIKPKNSKKKRLAVINILLDGKSLITTSYRDNKKAAIKSEDILEKVSFPD